MAIGEAILTAEEYGRMPDDGRFTELVRGRIVELTRPTFAHGLLCNQVSFLLSGFVRARDLGRITTNDSGIVTRRGPDTVRGADVAFYSYARLPKETRPVLYPAVAPDLVFEVRSPSDRWKEIHVKVGEYIGAGVLVVCVLDPEPMQAHLFYPDQPNRVLKADDELTLPECLGPDFRIVVRQFFE
ncbi:Uma2 family endonuclease [Tundrisphaera lichenicola]|uniref:Uma2 family endonuclease n=1 Tax=Tundrisphaera lichenicola TaxID=2029860 RepID=UPI003EBC1A8E